MGKKILITSSTFPPQKNGVSHVAAAHAAGLARLGHDVTVATGRDPARGSMALGGAKIRQFEAGGNAMLLRGGYTGDVEGYKRFIASFDGDLIICHCWQIWSTDLAVDAFAGLRCPKVLVSHGVSAAVRMRGSLEGLLRWLAWKPYLAKLPGLLWKFDHVVLLSGMRDRGSFFDHDLIHRLGYRSHSVIPNGVDPRRFDEAALSAAAFRERHSLGTRPVLLYVSNYDQRKNQKMAMEAFLKAGVPHSALVLIGSEMNEYAREAQSWAQKRRSTDRQIIFLEKLTVEETASAFCAADLFICSSKWELQPLVILEAMAAGKAFVSIDVGCVREMPGGVVVSNVEEMARAIRELLADEPRRRALSEQGRKAIAGTYNWEAVVRRYGALIADLTSSAANRIA